MVTPIITNLDLSDKYVHDLCHKSVNKSNTVSTWRTAYTDFIRTFQFFFRFVSVRKLISVLFVIELYDLVTV